MSFIRFVGVFLTGILLVGIVIANQAFEWESASPATQALDTATLQALQEDLATRRTKSLLVIRNDQIVWEWYAPDHGPDKRHYTASLAKSLVGGMSLALAMDDGLIRPDDPAWKYIPAWKNDPVKSRITIRHLATHSSGVEDAASPESGKSHDELPGWKGDFWKGRSEEALNPISIAVHQAPIIFEPGTGFAYSNPGMAALSYAITAGLRNSPHKDIRSLLEARLMNPAGIGAEEWQIGYGRTYTSDGLPVVANWGGGGFTARAVARIGRLLLNQGSWQGEQLIRPEHIREMLSYRGTPLPERPAANPYPAPALGWYNNSDGIWPAVPRDAFAGAGAGNQVLLVVPSLDLIVVRNGGVLDEGDDGHDFWGALEAHLFNPVMQAIPPYPASSAIERIEWAPVSTIIRKAEGSDNWPLTWADDGALYTAYGDGWGFDPRVPEKLSLGLAKVVGDPDSFEGLNIRSPSGEALGDGAAGKKASGILMVEGVLYLWARNAGNSQLAWSRDYGETWTWADWKFTTSFGAPTFLNFGKNYAGARDDYVYIYSFDSDSAYVPADRMVLARVPSGRITDRSAYEFFAGLNASGEPAWSRDIEQRGAVFKHPGECYRSGITYNAPLGRYLWVQVLPGGDPEHRGPRSGPRFEGGFGVYEAPELWGPWSTVYFTRQWDTGPGETSSFPTKWMSENGLTLHLVFSGEDHFSVRKATLVPQLNQADSLL
ncbi:MAG: serine hydrolase [Acidobacteriota bacterium]